MEKKKLPMWFKLFLVGSGGAAVPFAANKLLTDSPVHFGVVGQAPLETDSWECAPEGGVYGAPLVCHPVQTAKVSGVSAEPISTGAHVKTQAIPDAHVVVPEKAGAH